MHEAVDCAVGEKKQSFLRKPLKPDRFPEMLGNNGVWQEICAAPSNGCSVLGTGTLRHRAALHPTENACTPFPRHQCVVRHESEEEEFRARKTLFKNCTGDGEMGHRRFLWGAVPPHAAISPCLEHCTCCWA